MQLIIPSILLKCCFYHLSSLIALTDRSLMHYLSESRLLSHMVERQSNFAHGVLQEEVVNTWEAAKKKFFLSVPATKALPLYPLELSSHIFFRNLFCRSFFLVALTPPSPLSGHATKKRTFFCGFPEY